MNMTIDANTAFEKEKKTLNNLALPISFHVTLQ